MEITQESSFKRIASGIFMLACILLLSSCGSGGGGGGPSFDSEGTEDNPVILSLDTLKQGYVGTVGKKGSSSYYRVEGLIPNAELYPEEEEEEEEEDLYEYDYIFVVKGIDRKKGLDMEINRSSEALASGGGSWGGGEYGGGFTDMVSGISFYEEAFYLGESTDLDVVITNYTMSKGAEYVMGMRNPAPSETVYLSKAEAEAGYKGFTGDDISDYIIEGLGTNKNYQISITKVKNIGNGEDKDLLLCFFGAALLLDVEGGGNCVHFSHIPVIKIKPYCTDWNESTKECTGGYSNDVWITVESYESALAEVGYKGHSFTLKIKEL